MLVFFNRKFVRTGLFLLSGVPLLFLLIIIQWSGITHPFQDHWEDVQYLITYYDHGLLAAVRECFGAVTNHTRPIVLRLIFLLNGAATDWDIRSEYAICYAVFVGTLLAHWGLIRRLVPRDSVAAAAALLMASILAFSPGGHNNHWWSFMLQLTLTNLLSLVALGAMCFAPKRVSTNVLAAALTWMAAYILTNGLFLALVLGLLAWLGNDRRLLSWPTLFWAVNIVVMFGLYFSSPLPDSGMASRPDLLRIVAFTLVYLGNPISSLIYFQYPDMYQPHPGVRLSGGLGILGLLAATWTLWRQRLALFRAPPPHLLLLLGFFAYSVLSALATAKGRVDVDAFGIRAGNYSRYTIFGSYLWFGLLYYYLSELVGAGRVRESRIAFAAVLIAGLASISYARSVVPVYKQVRDKDRELGRGFTYDASPTSIDPYLYPTSEFLNAKRRELLRLGIGPYRDRR